MPTAVVSAAKIRALQAIKVGVQLRKIWLRHWVTSERHDFESLSFGQIQFQKIMIEMPLGPDIIFSESSDIMVLVWYKIGRWKISALLIF